MNDTATLWIAYPAEYLLATGWGVRHLRKSRRKPMRSYLPRREVLTEEVATHVFDTSPRSQDHWTGVVERLRMLAGDRQGSQQWVRQAYKLLRRSHSLSRERTWDQVLPPEIVSWACGRLEEVSSGEPCVDNYRVACLAKSSQRRRYRRRMKDGCCGFEDWREEGPDGQWYALGFNYGH